MNIAVARRVVLLCLASLAVLLPLGFYERAFYADARETVCTVTRTWIAEDNSFDGPPSERPRVDFFHEATGRRVEIHNHDVAYSPEPTTFGTVLRFTVNSTHRCWYDPDSPTRAQFAPPSFPIVLTIGPLLPAIFLIGALRRLRRGPDVLDNRPPPATGFWLSACAFFGTFWLAAADRIVFFGELLGGVFLTAAVAGILIATLRSLRPRAVE
jgi:hypothetical protein